MFTIVQIPIPMYSDRIDVPRSSSRDSNHHQPLNVLNRGRGRRGTNQGRGSWISERPPQRSSSTTSPETQLTSPSMVLVDTVEHTLSRPSVQSDNTRTSLRPESASDSSRFSNLQIPNDLQTLFPLKEAIETIETLEKRIQYNFKPESFVYVLRALIHPSKLRKSSHQEHHSRSLIPWFCQSGR
jgi:hypothetical protein